jgi:pimeloyl-ACP methyl ester carboxylesterase
MLPVMDAYVAAIEDGFQEFGIANDAVLIGNGFGGTVALAFAMAHPERISKLLLSDAAACFPPEGRKAFELMAAKVAEGGLGSIAEIAAKRVFSPAYLTTHPEAIEERKAVLLEIDPKAFPAACKILQEADLEPMLHRMRVPTLVVCGEFDQATPPALNKLIADKVAGSRYVELPGCGHCPPLEQPDQFLAAIKDFVGL